MTVKFGDIRKIDNVISETIGNVDLREQLYIDLFDLNLNDKSFKMTIQRLIDYIGDLKNDNTD